MSDTQTTAIDPVEAIVSMIPLEDIRIVDRHRKHFDDMYIRELADSIVAVGLLSPVVLSPGNRLLDGECRIRAYRLLGLAEIEARTVVSITEARDMLIAERDANAVRRDMLPSEKASLGMAIEELEKPAALERQGTRTDLVVPGPQGDGWGHKTRDIAAEAVGLSEPTYRRIKQALVAAGDETESEEVRAVAREVIEDIDAGKPIRAAVERIRIAKTETNVIEIGSGKSRAEQAVKWAQVEFMAGNGMPSAQIAAKFSMSESGLRAGAKERGIEFPADRFVGNSRRVNSTDLLEKTVVSLEVTADTLPLVSYEGITPEQALEWLARIEEPLRVIRRMATALKEIQ